MNKYTLRHLIKDPKESEGIRKNPKESRAKSRKRDLNCKMMSGAKVFLPPTLISAKVCSLINLSPQKTRNPALPVP